MGIGERLKTWRNLRHLSGAKLGAALGVGQSAVANWESDRSAPAPDKLAILSEMGLNLNWLLTGKGPMLLEDSAEPQSAPAQLTPEQVAEIVRQELDKRVREVSAVSSAAQAVLNPPSRVRRRG